MESTDGIRSVHPHAQIGKPGSKAKHWVFTSNNYTDDLLARLRILGADADYMVYGKEVSESGTPHLQGYVAMPIQKSLSMMSKLIPNSWLAVKYTKSTPNQAANYCKKDGNFVEFGVLPEAQNVAGGQVIIYVYI